MSVRQQQRRGTWAEWEAAGWPVLAAGELGLVHDPPSGTNHGRFKVGDGTSAFNVLPWATGPVTPNPAGGAENFAPLDDPTFTTGLTTPALHVDGDCEDLRIVPADPANIALDIEVPNDQTAAALSIRKVADPDPDIDLLTVAADGTVTVPGDFDVSGGVTAGDASQFSLIDGVLTLADAAGIDIVLDPTATGDDLAINVTDGLANLFRVTAGGRLLKGGASTGNAEEVLNITEADGRYQQALNTSGAGPIGCIVHVNTTGSSFALPASGTWIAFYIVFVNSQFSASALTQVTGISLSLPAGGDKRGFAIRVA